MKILKIGQDEFRIEFEDGENGEYYLNVLAENSGRTLKLEFSNNKSQNIKGLETLFLIARMLKNRGISIPEKIWHYTNGDSPFKIIESETFLASHIQFMNDIKEYTDGIDMLEKIISSYNDKNVRPSQRIDLRLKKDEIIDYLKKDIEANDIFVLSFSTLKDNLNQWRGYANPPLGCSLGLNLFDFFLSTPENLSRDDSARFRNFRIWEEYKKSFSVYFDGVTFLKNFGKSSKSAFCKCVYKKSEKKKLCKAVLREALNSNGIQKEELARKFRIAASIMKHPSSKTEKEWRVILFIDKKDKEKIKYRVRPSYFVPFVAYPFDANSVKDIVVAPCADKETARYSLQKFMDDKGICANVTNSELPYRNW